MTTSREIQELIDESKTRPNFAASVHDAKVALMHTVRLWKEMAPHVKIPTGFETFSDFVSPMNESAEKARLAIFEAERGARFLVDVVLAMLDGENLGDRLAKMLAVKTAAEQHKAALQAREADAIARGVYYQWVDEKGEARCGAPKESFNLRTLEQSLSTCPACLALPPEMPIATSGAAVPADAIHNV
jgi:hypothetical protein